MVRKVKATVTAVERNRVKYPHIDDRELASRKSFMGNLESVRCRGFARAAARVHWPPS